MLIKNLQKSTIYVIKDTASKLFNFNIDDEFVLLAINTDNNIQEIKNDFEL